MSIFKAAVKIFGGKYRVVQRLPPPLVDELYLSKQIWNYLFTSTDDDATISAAISASTGYDLQVDTFTGTFELRKLQIRYNRNSGEALPADPAVTTHHFAKVVSGSIVDTWESADFVAAEAAYTAFWNAIKANFDPTTVLAQYRWYRVGPAIAQSGGPVRVADPMVAGTSTATTIMPPQVAMTVTEKTTDPRSWGRFYLPAPGNTSSTPETGRLAVQSSLADAADAMYEAWYTAGTAPVVYSIAKPARGPDEEEPWETKGESFPAIGARALPVKQIQVDDVFDVIRSRRWKTPLVRIQRDIAGS